MPGRERDTGGATSVCVRAAKRKFRIVKRENHIPVLGVCEYCNAEFATDPDTIGRPKDAHAHPRTIHCTQMQVAGCQQKPGADRGRRLPNRRSTSGRPSITVANRRLRVLTSGH